MNPRVPFRITLVGALALGAFAGCSAHLTQAGSGGTLSLASGEVRISVPEAPTAYVQSGGGLQIGRRMVPLSPSAQALARRYYRYAFGVAAAGKTTAEAG